MVKHGGGRELADTVAAITAEAPTRGSAMIETTVKSPVVMTSHVHHGASAAPAGCRGRAIP